MDATFRDLLGRYIVDHMDSMAPDALMNNVQAVKHFNEWASQQKGPGTHQPRESAPKLRKKRKTLSPETIAKYQKNAALARAAYREKYAAKKNGISPQAVS